MRQRAFVHVLGVVKFIDPQLSASGRKLEQTSLLEFVFHITKVVEFGNFSNSILSASFFLWDTTVLLTFLHAEWLASSDPLGALQNSEWAPLVPTFWIGMGPLAIWVAQIEKLPFQMGPSLMVCAAFLESKKHECVKPRKTCKTPTGSTQNACCLQHVFYEYVSCLWKSAHYKSAFVFQNGLPSFLDCVFYHLKDAPKNMSRRAGRQVLSVSV